MRPSHPWRLLLISQLRRQYGLFVLAALNGRSKPRKRRQEEAGLFDRDSMIEPKDVRWETPTGWQVPRVGERGYGVQTLLEIVGRASWVVEHVEGGAVGRWGRRPPGLDGIEILIVAH